MCASLLLVQEIVNNMLSYKCILKYIYYTSVHGKGCTSCVISEYYFGLKYKIS